MPLLSRLSITSPLIHILVLLGLFLPYSINLGDSSLWDANEAFYAETPREMLTTGNYLAPQFNFQPRAQKPPLTYWIILLSYMLFGISEFAVRLPGALAAIGMILFTYGIGRSLFGPRPALIAAVIAATTTRIFLLARKLPIDILLLFFLMGTLFFLVRAIKDKSANNWALAYAFAGLGFLTKGPIALIIPAGTYLIWALWVRRFKLSEIHLLKGLLIFLTVVAPWYVLIYRAHGWTYILPFFLRDNIGRFATESLGPARGILYYFPVYLADYFPWSVLTLVALYYLWAKRRAFQYLRDLSFGLPLVWCALVFLFFSFSKNKQEYYITPLYPVMAVILSSIIDRTAFSKADPDSGWRQSAWLYSYSVLAILFLALSALMPFVLRSFLPDSSTVLHYTPSLVLLILIVILAWNIINRRPSRCYFSLAIPLWILFMLLTLIYLPALEAYRPVKEFCRTIELHSIGNHEAGYYGAALPSMVFYLGYPIFEEYSEESMVKRFRSDHQVFCVLTRSDYDYFINKKGLILYILDSRYRITTRLSSLFDRSDGSEEELLLVSNQYN